MNIATVRAHHVAISIADIPAPDVLASEAQGFVSGAAPVLADGVAAAVVPEVAPDKTAIPAIAATTAPATRETVVGAGMQTGPLSTKCHIYE